MSNGSDQVTNPTPAAGGRAVIAETDSALAELDAVLAAADAVTLHGDDAHEWTASDVWAHLWRWLAVSAEVVERHLNGERDIHDYDGGGDEFNLGWIEDDRGLHVDEARRRAFESWRELRRLLASVDAGRWNGFIEAYGRGNGVGHVLEHLEYVTAASTVAPPPRVAQQLEEDRACWTQLVAALDARPGETLHDPESPSWTSREVFGHFAHWIEHSTADFEAQLQGGETPALEGDDDSINARWAAADAGHDLEAMRARALRAFGRRSQLILSTPAERWTDGMMQAAAADGALHIQAHLDYLTAAAAGS